MAWWVNEKHRPSWTEAAERIDRLHLNGPTAEAFTFRKLFNSRGEAVRMKAERPAM